MPEVAIVDYGLGNLFSILSACKHSGLQAFTTHDSARIAKADALILPGVGAFGDAMKTLHRLDLVQPIRDYAATGRPLLGICLGIQLLMQESLEFGRHPGLGLVEGEVVPIDRDSRVSMKVPKIGWNHLNLEHQPGPESFLRGISEQDYFYFIHSFVAVPSDRGIVTSTATYQDVTFCSSVQKGNVFACQFHPERSGPSGLKLYKNLARSLESKRN